MRASGQASRSPNMGAYGGLGGRCKTQLRLNAPIIFFGPETGTISTSDHRTPLIFLARIDLFTFTIRSPVWETAPISVSICSPSQFADLHGKPHRFLYRSVRLHSSLTCMGNRTGFCTSDHHLGITHGRKTVSPSRNPCDSDPFCVAIHNRCSPS